MSRFWEGESDNPLDWGRYAAALRSSLQGHRGQRLLRDLIAGLDALPEPELAARAPADRRSGCVCALGAVALQRGRSLEELLEEDPYDWCPEDIAPDFDIARTLANEVMYENDDWRDGRNDRESRCSRWRRMRTWAVARLLD